MSNRYKIAEIALEMNEDGSITYWCYNVGNHAGQGGMEFCYGNFGTNKLESSLDLLKEKLLRDQDDIINELKAKVARLEKKDET
jgi:hypothetical protein